MISTRHRYRFNPSPWLRTSRRIRESATDPCKSSGWEWKSVTRSSIDRGSRTKLQGCAVVSKYLSSKNLEESAFAPTRLRDKVKDAGSHREGDATEIHTRSQLADQRHQHCRRRSLESVRAGVSRW